MSFTARVSFQIHTIEIVTVIVTAAYYRKQYSDAFTEASIGTCDTNYYTVLFWKYELLKI